MKIKNGVRVSTFLNDVPNWIFKLIFFHNCYESGYLEGINPPFLLSYKKVTLLENLTKNIMNYLRTCVSVALNSLGEIICFFSQDFSPEFFNFLSFIGHVNSSCLFKHERLQNLDATSRLNKLKKLFRNLKFLPIFWKYEKPKVAMINSNFTFYFCSKYHSKIPQKSRNIFQKNQAIFFFITPSFLNNFLFTNQTNSKSIVSWLFH